MKDQAAISALVSAAGHNFWWLPDRKLFPPPVSFQLDQLTDLAKSDATESLDPT